MASNSLWLWLVALAAAAVGFTVLRLALSLLTSRFGRLAEGTRTYADDLLVGTMRATGRFFVAVVALIAASLLLDLSGTASVLRKWAAVVAVTLQVGLWGQRGITLWLDHQRESLLESDPGSVTTLQGLSTWPGLLFGRRLACSCSTTWGLDVSALLAGLGIGGIAVALALQNILGDLFASLSIALDKPFVTGDFIIVGDMMGTVSHVGLKTTRITSLSGEQLVFANADLLGSRIPKLQTNGRTQGRLFNRSSLSDAS